MKRIQFLLILCFFPLIVWAGKEEVVVANTAGASVSFSTDSNFDWQWDANEHRLQSSNAYVDNSTSSITITITCSVDFILSFDCEVSSESYDIATIYLGSTTIAHMSSKDKTSFCKKLVPGTYNLKFTYTKDSEDYSFDDRAYLSNLQIISIIGGNCGVNGNNVQWNFNVSTGALVFSGSGEMSAGAPWHKYHEYILSTTIGNNITSIGDEMFKDCSKISSISIPNGVTKIGNEAFWACKGLTSVTIPYSVRTIGDQAFLGCSGLTSITIPNNVTSIGDGTFNSCSQLSSITLGNSVQSIGNNAFDRCAMTSITLPESLRTIGNNAFSNCSNLTSINISDNVTSIGQNAFYNCNHLASVTIGYNVISIGQYAFNGCTALTSVIWNAHNFTSPYFESFSPFYGIRNQITSFLIGDDVFSIPSYLCYGMGNLESILLGKNVISIGDEAFYSSGLTSIILPASVNSVGYFPFGGCQNLAKIVVKASTPPTVQCRDVSNRWDDEPVYSYNLGSYADIYVPYGSGFAYRSANGWNECSIHEVFIFGDDVFGTLNGTTLTISGTGAMYDDSYYMPDRSRYSNVTDVIVEDGVTTIGRSIFSSRSQLASVSLPNSITHIDSYAFSNCPSLTNLIIPENVVSIDRYAFINIPAISVDANNSKYDSRNNCNAVIETATNSLIFGSQSTIIPNTVTSIAKDAFHNCDLASITIPESVVSIDANALDWCNSIGSVIINSQTIASTNYTSTRNNLRTLFGSKASSYTFGGNVTSIGDYALSGGSEITEVILNEGITSIGYYALGGTSITSLSIPNSVLTIGEHACDNCRSLASLTFGNSIQTIGAYAFAESWNVTSIHLPASVTSIGDWAFSVGLTSITIDAITPPAIGQYAINDRVSRSIPVYVSCGCSAAYQTAAYWSEFTNIQEICSPEDISYARSTTTGRYGTICLPRAVNGGDVTNAKIFNIVFVLKNNNEEITHLVMEEETGNLVAGKPYIFRALADEISFVYTGAPVTEPAIATGLVGNLNVEDYEVPQGKYILSNNQFRMLAGGTATIGKNRAYIDLDDVAAYTLMPAGAPGRVVLSVEGNSPVATDITSHQSHKADKIIRDGMIYILRDNQTYDVVGRKMF